MQSTTPVTLALLALLTGASQATVSRGGAFELRSNTIDSGGGVSQASGFILQGSIGQPDASPQMIGGDFELTGGFWAGSPATPLGDDVFMDGFEEG